MFLLILLLLIPILLIYLRWLQSQLLGQLLHIFSGPVVVLSIFNFELIDLRLVLSFPFFFRIFIGVINGNYLNNFTALGFLRKKWLINKFKILHKLIEFMFLRLTLLHNSIGERVCH